MIRSRLRHAVDALCNEELQVRLWLGGERQSSDELTFDDAVLFVLDELLTADPGELVGHVLNDEEELACFLHLSCTLDKLLTVIGVHGTFEDAVQSGSTWQGCLAAAKTLRGSLHD